MKAGTILLTLSLAAASVSACGVADTDSLDAIVSDGWTRVMRAYYWEPTSLIYTCLPKDVQKASFYTNGFKVWEKNGDYGHGLEDCAIIGGVALSGLCDRYAVTGEESLRADARKIAQGLVNLCTVHGVKGFVARGICVEDGKSVCALSSIDQHTHCLHGLWRYWRSALLDPSLKGEIARVVAEVADRMTAQVTEANDWSFQQATGRGTTRGICKMRFNWPHEGARLAMVYAVAWDVTRKAEYHALWRKYLNEGLENSMRLKTASPEELKGYLARMPNYSLLQMQTSLEVLHDLAQNKAERARVRAAMQRPAELAAERAKANGTSSGRWLCSCAELSLAQTMARGFAAERSQEAFLAAAIAAEPFATAAGSCRIVHLATAWWRARRTGAVGPRKAPRLAPAVHAQNLTYISHVHRGGGKKESPDNTLETFTWCWQNGSALECDCRKTKDGVGIMLHDETLKRTGRGIAPEMAKKKVSKELTWAEVKDVDVGSYLGPQFAHHRIPTIDAVFAAMKGHPKYLCFVDEKGAGPQMIAEKAVAAGVQDQVYYTGPSHENIFRWQKVLPGGKSLLWLGAWPKNHGPAERARADDWFRAKMAELRARDFKFISAVSIHTYYDPKDPDDPFVPSTDELKKMVDEFHAHGIPVASIPFMGGELEETYWRLYDLGFDGFSTDYPSVMFKVIREIGAKK